MDIHQYKENAKRTMSRQWHLTELDTELLHGAIGMVTEAQELLVAVNPVEGTALDTVNLMEEVSDLFWYLTIFQRYYTDCDWEDVDLPASCKTLEDYVDVILTSTINVLDGFKKWAYYGKPLSENAVKADLYLTYRCCVGILNLIGYNIDDTRTINIKKLKDRFPDKFTSEDAINRDLDTERKTLEGQA